MDTGADSLGDLAQVLVRSTEYENDHAHGVIRLYQAAFGRIPDQAGFEYWSDKLFNAEHALQDVSALFVTSPEFTTRFGSDPAIEVLVARMYQNTFGREPDAEGFAYWVNEVQNGMSVSDLLLNFTESAEAVSLLDPYVQTVMLYHQLTERMPTVSEQLAAPQTISALVDTLWESSDFIGPDPAIPVATIEGVFEADVLTLSGQAGGSVLIDAVTESITENRLTVSVTDLDWLTLTAVDASAVTGADVSVTGSDTALNLTLGSNVGSVQLGDLADTLTLVAAPQIDNNSIDLGFGANTLILDRPMSVDLMSEIQGVGLVTGSIGNDQLAMRTQALTETTIDSGEGTDRISVTGGGLIDLAALADIAGVEEWAATDNEDYDVVGTDADDFFVAGSGSHLIALGGGADTIYLGDGVDVIAYNAVADSQFNTDTPNTFSGDTLFGFDCNDDQFDLPFTVDGEFESIEIAVAFTSSLSATLASNEALTTAFSTDNDGDDIDAAFVSVQSGSASGYYLVAQNAACAAAFDPVTDLVVQLATVSNLDAASVDLFI